MKRKTTIAHVCSDEPVFVSFRMCCSIWIPLPLLLSLLLLLLHLSPRLLLVILHLLFAFYPHHFCLILVRRRRERARGTESERERCEIDDGMMFCLAPSIRRLILRPFASAPVAQAKRSISLPPSVRKKRETNTGNSGLCLRYGLNARAGPDQRSANKTIL